MKIECHTSAVHAYILYVRTYEPDYLTTCVNIFIYKVLFVGTTHITLLHILIFLDIQKGNLLYRFTHGLVQKVHGTTPTNRAIDRHRY